MNLWTAPWSTVMQLETKYLRLRTAVTLGSRFGDWRVYWLGGWSRHRLFYLVLSVRVEPLKCVTRLVLRHNIVIPGEPLLVLAVCPGSSSPTVKDLGHS